MLIGRTHTKSRITYRPRGSRIVGYRRLTGGVCATVNRPTVEPRGMRRIYDLSNYLVTRLNAHVDHGTPVIKWFTARYDALTNAAAARGYIDVRRGG